TEAADGELFFEHGGTAAVLDRDCGARAHWHRGDANGRNRTRQALEVHLLARAIDAAIGLDEAAHCGLAAASIHRDAEVPHLDAIGPVAVEKGDVLSFFDHRDQTLRAVPLELTLPPLALLAVLEALRVGGTGLVEQRAGAGQLEDAVAVGAAGVDA